MFNSTRRYISQRSKLRAFADDKIDIDKGIRTLKNGIFDRVFSGISVVLRETTLTTLDSIETDSPVEGEIVIVVSLSAMEIAEITRFIKKKGDL